MKTKMASCNSAKWQGRSNNKAHKISTRTLLRLIPMKENVLHEALKGNIMHGSRQVHHDEVERIFATYDKVSEYWRQTIFNYNIKLCNFICLIQMTSMIQSFKIFHFWIFKLYFWSFVLFIPKICNFRQFSLFSSLLCQPSPPMGGWVYLQSFRAFRSACFNRSL